MRVIVRFHRFASIIAALWIFAASPAHAQLPPADSAAINEELREETFRFVMAWRYEWWVDMGDLAFDPTAWKVRRAWRGDSPVYDDQADSLPTIEIEPRLGCTGRSDSIAHRDPIGLDPAALQRRAVELAIERERGGYSCFGSRWSPQYVKPLPDPRLGFDRTLADDPRLGVRALRKSLIEALDAGAKKLPGDGWIVGQLVRMHVDQEQPTPALAATRECRADAWWCLALRGYVWYSIADYRRAAAVFDSSLAVAPDSVSCAWNDVSMLLTAAAAQAFRRLSCIDHQRELFVDRIWWLADPLYLEAGNERRVEHYGRVMLLALRTMTDSVDGIFDYRDRRSPAGRYEGSTFGGRTPIQEHILRYGYPIASRGCHRNVCSGGDNVGPPYVGRPGLDRAPVQRWRRFDTKSVYLGTYSTYFWPGPQYHTMPTWAAVADPPAATSGDWNIAPRMLDAENWDHSWWPSELMHRDRGPLFELPTQIAFLRRSSTALIAAAAEWDTLRTFRRPPERAVFGMAVSRGPRDTMLVIAARIDGRAVPPIFSPITSDPVLIGIEMIATPDASHEAAARTRFGASPPPPLSRLAPGTIALSDPILVTSSASRGAPASLQETLDRMYGTTTLDDPKGVPIAWESYGVADADTLEMALRIIRRESPGPIRRALASIGVGAPGADSLVIRWQETIRDGAPPVDDAGTLIRFRSLVVDMSNLARGEYTLEISTERRGSNVAVGRRDLVVRR